MSRGSREEELFRFNKTENYDRQRATFNNVIRNSTVPSDR